MIAIKGMKTIPKSCSECPLLCGLSGEQGCSVTGEPYFSIKECPLKEIVICKDCKHWQRIKDYHGRCKLFDEVWRGNSLVPIEHGTNEEFYCQMAERRE